MSIFFPPVERVDEGKREDLSLHCKPHMQEGRKVGQAGRRGGGGGGGEEERRWCNATGSSQAILNDRL